MPEIYELLGSGLMRLLIAAVILIAGKIVIPWLKEQRVYSLVVKLVRAAEKLAESGAITKESKKIYVIKLLESRGIKITPSVEAFIEAAVTELDIAIESGVLFFPEFLPEIEINDAEVEDALADEIVYAQEGKTEAEAI